MAVHTLDPLSDPRWGRFVDVRKDAAIFHTPQWLEAIRKTYGYESIVYTTTPAGQPLIDGVVVCRVQSWLTGKRLVGVPFADHCELLVNDEGARGAILKTLQETVRTDWKYVEIRPRHVEVPLGDQTFHECDAYFLHVIDLRPSIEEIFARLHKDSNQRKIRRAERQGLTYEEGRSETLLADFYRLHLQTRRRHQLPPQPIEWFRNLMNTMADRLTICAASTNGKPVGSIIVMRHRDTLVYKYGASDASSHNLGTMPLIFWRVICAAKASGVQELDLGRSNPADAGLITFKDRLGADRTRVRYFKHSSGKMKVGSIESSSLASRMKPLFARLPDSLLVATGKLLYRHIG